MHKPPIEKVAHRLVFMYIVREIMYKMWNLQPK